MPAISLRLRAIFLRIILSILTFFDLYLSRPLPRRVSFRRKIVSTESSVPGTIELLFYTSQSYKPTKGHHEKLPLINREKRPLLVNFHGGGFTIGHARDDARWATTVTSETDAVVVSVNYRLAPEYPFPVGIDDCVSAILWLWRHADELNIDISRTALSGFSAGGNLTYAVSMRLYEVLTRFKSEDGLESVGALRGKIVSLVVFYGSTDWTQTRAEREASNSNLIPTIPPRLFKLFDAAYLSSKPHMRSPFLSPGLADEELLRDALPESLVLINCAGDQLLAESERFRERLVVLGKKVDGCIVEGVGHGWDKKATYGRGDVKRDFAYGLAVESLRKAWADR